MRNPSNPHIIISMYDNTIIAFITSDKSVITGEKQKLQINDSGYAMFQLFVIKWS